MEQVRLALIIAAMAEMDLENPDNVISGGRPDLEALREVAEDDSITGKERDEAFKYWQEDAEDKGDAPSSKGTSTLVANATCRVKKGEVQICWGSNFTAKEIKNPELDEEFPEEGAPEKILVLEGSFTKEDEIKSLLSSKRAKRA